MFKNIIMDVSKWAQRNAEKVGKTNNLNEQIVHFLETAYIDAHNQTQDSIENNHCSADDDFVDRVRIEKTTLGERLVKLQEFIQTEKFTQQVPDYEKKIMWRQLQAMSNYYECLCVRYDLLKHRTICHREEITTENNSRPPQSFEPNDMGMESPTTEK